MKTRKQRVVVKPIHGYTVIIVPTPSDTLIVRASVGTGFIRETKENLGIHHLLEHVLVNSWKHCEPNCVLYWDKEGCVLNASTEKTTVNYYIKGLPDIAENMILYMISILIRPEISTAVIQREKKAVITELNISMNHPEYTLLNTFNHHFYEPEGLKYSYDASVHLHNVNSFTLRDVTRAHQSVYTPDNMVFVVYGDISMSKVTDCFSKHLPVSMKSVPPLPSCHTYTSSFLHVHRPSATVVTLLGFPMEKFYSGMTHEILSVLLFDVLRTKHQLVYNIKCSISQDHCHSSLKIRFECASEDFIKTLAILLRTLHEYTTTLISHSILKGIQRKLIYMYHTEYTYDTYYSSYVFNKRPLLTKAQLIQHVKSFTTQQFRSFMKDTIQFQSCTLVYQCPTKIPVDWTTFLKIDTRGNTHLLV
jgi:predicted Zn-dependent peptidase